MKKSYILSIIACLLLAVSYVSAQIPVTGVTVSPSTLTVVAGAYKPLTATIAPANATNATVAWSTSNSNVARVSVSGVVTGMAVGTATITATTQDGSFTSTSAVTVSAPAANYANNPGFEVNTAPSATATNWYEWGATPANGNVITGNISLGDAVGGTPHGGTNYLAFSGDGVTTNEVNYKQDLSNLPNGYYTLKFWFRGNNNGNFSGYYNIGGSYPNWSFLTNQWTQRTISNVSVTNGTATININYKSTTGGSLNIDDVEMTLNQYVLVTGINAVSPATKTLSLNETVTLTTTTIPSNASNAVINWSSSNTSVATVSAAGLVTAVSGGTATITATTSENGFTSSSVITVLANYVKNPGFESDTAPYSASPTYWYKWLGGLSGINVPNGRVVTGNNLLGDVVGGTPHSGTNYLEFAGSGTYEVDCKQDLSGIPNGTYTMKFWCRGNNASGGYYNIGGTYLGWGTLPSQWTQKTINNVSVTNGTASINFIFNTTTGGSLNIDDVELRPVAITISGAQTSSALTNVNADVIVPATAELTIDASRTVQSVTLNPGAKLTISGGALTSTNGITLESDATGTATLVDSYSTPTINATVKQHLSSARNWYFTPAVSGVTVPASSVYFGYDEAGANEDLIPAGSSAYWKPYATSAPLTAGKGYIIQSGSATTLSFTNTTVSGDVSPVLTYNSGKGNGYNLVGNPYPSYLSWSAVASDPSNTNVTTGANMPTGTIWYRTVNYNSKNAWAANTVYNVNDVVYNGTRFYKATSTTGTSAASGSGPTGTGTGITDNGVVWNYEGSVYVFATVSASGVATPSSVNNLIPPMQAFWVKTTTGGGTLHFKNTMRSHNTTGGTNALKAPASSARQMPLVRLSVSNGASVDEAVVFATENATNAFDAYDAPKYFNTNSNQAEIYSQIGNEKLVINAMSEITAGTEIALGFVTEKSNNFKISATELKNIGADLQVVLKDKQLNREFDLSTGNGYEFSSAVVNDANRFSLQFRAPGVSTGLDNTNKLNTQVFVNAANQITIIASEKCNYAIYNAIGMLIENGQTTAKLQTVKSKLQTGMYVVKINNQSTRVIIK